MRCELFVFVKAFAKMYLSDRIEDSSTMPLPKKLCNQKHVSHVSTKVPSVLRYWFMCENIEVGDIVEYVMNASVQGPERNQLIKRATVVAIRLELDKTKSIVLNTGDKIVNSLHLMRRVSMKDLNTGEALWNPIKDWFELSKFYLHPTEDAADGPTKSLEVQVSPDDLKEFELAQRQNRAGEEATRQRRNKTKQNVRDRARDSTIHSGNMYEFFDWMDPRRIPTEILFLNTLYLLCIKFGKLGYFHKLLSAKNPEQYKTSKKNASRVIDKAKDRKGGFLFKSLFKFAFFVHATKGDTPTYKLVPEAEQKRPTKRTVKVREAISQFEMSNKHLKTQKCHACMEIHLNQVARTYDGSKPYKCGRCKKLPRDFYDKWLLQPVWHERNEGATCFDDFKLDVEGNKIVRYDLPEELESLTLSEKLLIRKCAPYVPSIYLGGGNFALKGQCVAFMQDITEMAEELPRQPNEIVTFIRKMGNSNTSEIHFQSLRVRRDFIVRALKWLKIHHFDYRHITIKESNLDWIGKKPKAESHMLGLIKTFHQKGERPPPQSIPAVSQIQCMNPSDEPNLDFSMMEDVDGGVNPEQKKHMDELVDAAVKTKKSHKLLLFPPHADTPVR